MATLTFEHRSTCISCSSTRWNAVWSGAFGDTSIAGFMDNYGYAVDWRSELADLPISLVQCAVCQTCFHEHILTPSSLVTLYSDWIDESQIDTLTGNLDAPSPYSVQFEAATKNVRHVLRLDRLLPQTFEPSQPWRVLDFGCGAAEFLKQASLFGFETWGIDFSSTRATQALNQQIEILSSLDELTEASPPPMHAITLFQVLEHLDHPKETLVELSQFLLPEGVLIIEVPNCEVTGEDDDIADAAALRENRPPQSFEEFRNVHPLEHINAFTPLTLTALVEGAGFTKIKPGPAHVTNRPDAVVKSELTRFFEPQRTNQYFRKD